MQQPIGAHVQEESELVGLPARAGGLVGSRKALHVLDQVLRRPTCAEHLLVERFAAAGETGDDEARVRAEPRGLYASDEFALPAPLAGLVGQLMKATYYRVAFGSSRLALCAPGRCNLEKPGVNGEADNVVAAHRFQLGQCRFAAILGVCAYQDRHLGPMLADAADNMAQDLGDLYPRGPLAGAQQGQHRLAAGAVENVDRLEAGAIVVRIEECQLLLTVGRIIGIVNVKHDAVGRPCKAPAIKIDLAEADTPEGAPVGQVLKPR